MKAKLTCILRLVRSLVATLVLCIGVDEAAETQPVQWNEEAQSQTMDGHRLREFGSAFPMWRIKQVTWPSPSETGAKMVAVDPSLAAQCVGWLSRFVRKGQLPMDFGKKLVAMREWGLIRKESEQERLCDVFIVRFKRGSVVVQIQESPYNVVIAFTDEKLADAPAKNHKELVVDVARALLEDSLHPPADEASVCVLKPVNGTQAVTRVVWIIESVVMTNEHGIQCMDSAKAAIIGATSVQAETDGRLIVFEIRKEVDGPGGLNPYLARFEPDPRTRVKAGREGGAKSTDQQAMPNDH